MKRLDGKRLKHMFPDLVEADDKDDHLVEISEPKRSNAQKIARLRAKVAKLEAKDEAKQPSV